MTDTLALSEQWTLWRLHDYFNLVQGAPLAKDPETGKTVVPTSLAMVYGWSRGQWWLVRAELSGPAVREDGTYPDFDDTRIDYYDPVAGEEDSGKAPDWVVARAESRMRTLPPPPPLPEGWNFNA